MLQIEGLADDVGVVFIQDDPAAARVVTATEEKLQVRRRGGRKRALGTRAPMVIPQGPNQRWSLDFAADAFSDGRRFRILTVVDDFTRECLALVADTSFLHL